MVFSSGHHMFFCYLRRHMGLHWKKFLRSKGWQRSTARSYGCFLAYYLGTICCRTKLINNYEKYYWTKHDDSCVMHSTPVFNWHDGSTSRASQAWRQWFPRNHLLGPQLVCLRHLLCCTFNTNTYEYWTMPVRGWILWCKLWQNMHLGQHYLLWAW